MLYRLTFPERQRFWTKERSLLDYYPDNGKTGSVVTRFSNLLIFQAPERNVIIPNLLRGCSCGSVSEKLPFYTGGCCELGSTLSDLQAFVSVVDEGSFVRLLCGVSSLMFIVGRSFRLLGTHCSFQHNGRHLRRQRGLQLGLGLARNDL